MDVIYFLRVPVSYGLWERSTLQFPSALSRFLILFSSLSLSRAEISSAPVVLMNSLIEYGVIKTIIVC